MKVTKDQFFTQLSDIDWEPAFPGARRKIACYGEDLMAVYVEFQKGAVGALHQHPHRQASFVHKGSFKVTVDGKEQILKAGDFFYVPANLMHGAVALEDSVLLDIFTPIRQEFLPTA